MNNTEERRRLRSSAQRLLHLLVAQAGTEMVEAAVKIMEADIAKWRASDEKTTV